MVINHNPKTKRTKKRTNAHALIHKKKDNDNDGVAFQVSGIEKQINHDIEKDQGPLVNVKVSNKSKEKCWYR